MLTRKGKGDEQHRTAVSHNYVIPKKKILCFYETNEGHRDTMGDTHSELPTNNAEKLF